MDNTYTDKKDPEKASSGFPHSLLDSLLDSLLAQRVLPPSIQEELPLISLEAIFKRDHSYDANQLWTRLSYELIKMIWSCSNELTEQGFFSKEHLNMLIPDSYPKIKALMEHFVHNKTDEEACTNQPLQSKDARMKKFADQLKDLLFNVNPNEVNLLIEELESLTHHFVKLGRHDGINSHTPQPESIKSMLNIIGDIQEHLHFFDGVFSRVMAIAQILNFLQLFACILIYSHLLPLYQNFEQWLRFFQ